MMPFEMDRFIEVHLAIARLDGPICCPTHTKLDQALLILPNPAQCSPLLNDHLEVDRKQVHASIPFRTNFRVSR